MFINRDYERTEHDDFVLNVQPYIGPLDGAIEMRADDGILVRWLIRSYME